MDDKQIIEMTAQGGNVSTWVQDDMIKDRIAEACSGLMAPGKFSVHMLTSLQNEDIAHCTERSKLVAFLECAALCILPSVGQCYLLPYKNKKEEYEVKVTPSWRGLKDIMERHPLVLELCPELVHKDDTFSVDNGQFTHSYDPFDPNRNIDGPKDIVGGYVKIVYADGRPPKYHTMSIKDISKNQACAKRQNVWQAWYRQMATKTLFRDCHSRKAVPLDPLVAHGVETLIRNDDVILGNDPMRALPAPKSKVEQAMPKQPTPEPVAEVASDLGLSDAMGELLLQEQAAAELSIEIEKPPYDHIIVSGWEPSIKKATEVNQCNQLMDEVKLAGIDKATTDKITELCNLRAEEIRGTRGAGSNKPNEGSE